jgi:hypothetical protein
MVVIVYPEKKFIIAAHNKCGTSAILSWFGDILGISLTKWNVYEKFIKNNKQYMFNPKNDYSDYKVIFVIRNPLDRLISAYLHIFVRDLKKTMSKKTGHIYSHDILVNPKYKMDNFVDLIQLLERSKNKEFNLFEDVHYSPQERTLGLLLNMNIKPDIIINTSDLSSGFLQLNSIFNLNGKVYNDNVNKLINKQFIRRNNTKYYLCTIHQLYKMKELPPYNQFYTDELEEKVKILMKEDYDIFKKINAVNV